MRVKILVPIVALILVAGCTSGRFSCQHTIDGVRCANLQTVYKDRVLGASTVAPAETTSYSQKVVRKKKLDRAKNGFFRNLVAQEPAEEEGEMDSDEVVRNLENDESRPIRIPPTILRIWTAPWEDQDGDLHKAGYIYTEISGPRGRWVIGERNVESAIGYITPHRPSVPVSMPDNPDKGQSNKGKGFFGSGGSNQKGKGKSSIPPMPGPYEAKDNKLTFGGTKR